MNKTFLRIVSYVITVLIVLTGVLSAFFEYNEMLSHPEWSAPPAVAFIKIIPYILVAALFFLLSHIFLKKI